MPHFKTFDMINLEYEIRGGGLGTHGMFDARNCDAGILTFDLGAWPLTRGL